MKERKENAMGRSADEGALGRMLNNINVQTRNAGNTRTQEGNLPPIQGAR